ncbi:unnamed protein product [Penicillium glandicola]
MEDTNRPLGGRPVGQQTVIPPPMEGEDVTVPALWAARIKNLPFGVARKGNRLKGRYLERLVAKPSQQEPYHRVGQCWTGQRFEEMINASLLHAEAALMQVVGHQSEVKCKACMQGNETFSHCVSMRGVAGLTACANYHWAGRDSKCKYIPAVGFVPSHQPQATPRNPDRDEAISQTPPLTWMPAGLAGCPADKHYCVLGATYLRL